MYAKIIDGQVAQYPYSVQALYEDNPNVGFPANLTDEMLGRFNAVRIIQTERPEHDHTKNCNEADPVYHEARDQWEQTWVLTDATQEEIDQRLVEQAEERRQRRAAAYRDESDPLYFQEQRGDVPLGTWLAKVAEIKARYPA